MFTIGTIGSALDRTFRSSETSGPKLRETQIPSSRDQFFLRVIRNSSLHFDVVVIGGGPAAIATVSSLRRLHLKSDNRRLRIAILDSSGKAFVDSNYLPSLISGAGERTQAVLQRSDLLPEDVERIKESVKSVDVEHNRIFVGDSGSVTYDYLVLAPSLVPCTAAIQGLAHVCGAAGVPATSVPTSSVQLSGSSKQRAKAIYDALLGSSRDAANRRHPCVLFPEFPVFASAVHPTAVSIFERIRILRKETKDKTSSAGPARLLAAKDFEAMKEASDRPEVLTTDRSAQPVSSARRSVTTSTAGARGKSSLLGPAEPARFSSSDPRSRTSGFNAVFCSAAAAPQAAPNPSYALSSALSCTSMWKSTDPRVSPLINSVYITASDSVWPWLPQWDAHLRALLQARGIGVVTSAKLTAVETKLNDPHDAGSGTYLSATFSQMAGTSRAGLSPMAAAVQDRSSKRSMWSLLSRSVEEPPSEFTIEPVDLLSVSLPVVPPSYLRSLPPSLRSPSGRVKVHPLSLQAIDPKYPRVFCVGDAAELSVPPSPLGALHQGFSVAATITNLVNKRAFAMLTADHWLTNFAEKFGAQNQAGGPTSIPKFCYDGYSGSFIATSDNKQLLVESHYDVPSVLSIHSFSSQDSETPSVSSLTTVANKATSIFPRLFRTKASNIELGQPASEGRYGTCILSRWVLPKLLWMTSASGRYLGHFQGGIAPTFAKVYEIGPITGSNEEITPLTEGR